MLWKVKLKEKQAGLQSATDALGAPRKASTASGLRNQSAKGYEWGVKNRKKVRESDATGVDTDARTQAIAAYRSKQRMDKQKAQQRAR
jgi:hypothetical protein